MEQGGFIRNISGTACAIGLAFSTIGVTNTMVVNIDYKVPSPVYRDCNKTSTNLYNNTEIGNSYSQKTTRLEQCAMELFGDMRDATPEEQASVDRYIQSISKDTGVSFFDLC